MDRIKVIDTFNRLGGSFICQENHFTNIKDKQNKKKGIDYEIPNITKGLIVNPYYTMQEKLLYIYVLSYVNEQGTYAFPSYSTIMKELGIGSKSTLSALLQACEDKHMFKKIKAIWIEKGELGNNMYFPNIYDKEFIHEELDKKKNTFTVTGGFDPQNLEPVKIKFPSGEALAYKMIDPILKTKEVIAVDNNPTNKKQLEALLPQI